MSHGGHMINVLDQQADSNADSNPLDDQSVAKIITHDHPPDMDHGGLSWTLRMGLRIRRLGVRISPGAL
jgi:hypothetical protein